MTSSRAHSMSSAEPSSGLLGQCPSLSARLPLALVCPHPIKGPKASPLHSLSLSFPICSSWELDLIFSKDLTALVYSEEGAGCGKGREPGLGQRWGSKEGFPGGSDGKAPVCNARDLGSIPGLGRSPGEGNGSPLQYSCLENPMDGGAW